MTLCELVTGRHVLKEVWKRFENGTAQNPSFQLNELFQRVENAKTFHEWLSGIQAPPIPKDVCNCDDGFRMVIEGLLTIDPQARLSCAQGLLQPYFRPHGEESNSLIHADQSRSNPLPEPTLSWYSCDPGAHSDVIKLNQLNIISNSPYVELVPKTHEAAPVHDARKSKTTIIEPRSDLELNIVSNSPDVEDIPLTHEAVPVHGAGTTRTNIIERRRFRKVLKSCAVGSIGILSSFLRKNST